MNKQDYIEQRKFFEKKFKRNDWIYTSIFISLLVVNWYVVSVLDWLPESWAWLYLVIFFGLLFGNLYVIKIFHRRQINNSGLKCYSCSQPLLADQGDIAIATGNCPMCGERAFE